MTTAQKIKRLRTKCDSIARDRFLAENPYCLICGAPTVDAHHFFPKSISSFLRYDFRNLISLCRGCHFSHHTKGDPKIHAAIIEIKGQDWYEDLRADSQKIQKVNLGYYEKVLRESNENYT